MPTPYFHRRHGTKTYIVGQENTTKRELAKAKSGDRPGHWLQRLSKRKTVVLQQLGIDLVSHEFTRENMRETRSGMASVASPTSLGQSFKRIHETVMSQTSGCRRWVSGCGKWEAT